MLNLIKKPSPAILRTVKDLRGFVSLHRRARRRIALVPTMGALHEGHIHLVREGLKRADIVIATIFVNPTQFGPKEDFSAYPRTWDADLAKLTDAEAHGVFYPDAHEMYPEGFQTTVHVKGVSEPLEGEHRPGHFDGVATVVSKLLLQSTTDLALFGEKDWQQLQVIKKTVADLNIPVTIEGIPTVRDEHGLALSSRNAYLSPEQLVIARRLNKIMYAMAEKVAHRQDIAAIQAWGHAEVLKAGFDSIDYLEIRDPQTLLSPLPHTVDLRILAAVRLGKARLIDNIPARVV